ncbi:hypothetical protein SAMN05192529_11248 [Arachidicoccus rhizosphaerae]|jgi:hypothetical protein|uniref:DUF2059 domain-containing protein n=1 Tax=Arachidicoccus rhizosphaerae TaxID=551991 RepID=A0A1H3ZUU7_9BACT|nr:DUF2059 domain-containing protein [Arachidicoccus rhizosphaerae]SEA27405.1 hypothetical protein SAMN05192529_11248 [Arachidicoccus rhizosphaerae]
MRKFICGLFCTILFSFGMVLLAKGQSNDAISPRKKALIMEMVDLVGTRKYIELMVDAVRDKLKQQDPVYGDMIVEEFSNYLSYDSMAAIILPIYAKHYSEEDLQGIIAFYKSPVGKKMLGEMPAILKESIEVNKARAELLEEKVTHRIQELQEKKQEESEQPADSSDSTPPTIVEGAENSALPHI